MGAAPARPVCRVERGRQTVRPRGRVRQRVLCAPRTGGRRASARTGTLAPERALAENTPSRNARGVVASPVPPREQAPARPPASDAAPELFVSGRRVTEADVIDALSMLGDEEVQAYREGRLPKAEAYRIAHHRLRTLARMTAGPW